MYNVYNAVAAVDKLSLATSKENETYMTTFSVCIYMYIYVIRTRARVHCTHTRAHALERRFPRTVWAAVEGEGAMKNIIARCNNVFVKGVFFFSFRFFPYAKNKNEKYAKETNNVCIIPLNCVIFLYAIYTNYPRLRFWIVFWLRPTRDFAVNNDLRAAVRDARV